MSIVVVQSIHVLIGGVLRIELPVTSFAIVLWAPVVECIYVLIGSLLTTKFAIASLALIVILLWLVRRDLCGQLCCNAVGKDRCDT
jgi:hypothetical protein